GFPARWQSSRNSRGTSDGSSAPCQERSAGRRLPEFSQTTRLPRAPAQEAAHELRPASHQARRATTRYFHGNQQPNLPIRAVASGIPLAGCLRDFAESCAITDCSEFSCLGSTGRRPVVRGSLPRTCFVALDGCAAECIRPATECCRLAACASQKSAFASP